MENKLKILFFTKRSGWCDRAARFIKKKFKNVKIISGERQDAFPKEAYLRKTDVIISYLSPWVLPGDILNKALVFAINFHPASPEYPGIGCYNFALYEGAKKYGVTCHHMAEKPDTGKIIAVKHFPVENGESVTSLKEKSMMHMFNLFTETIEFFIKNRKLPESSLRWDRRPFTRKELDKLCRVDMGMEPDEILRRAKATYFPGAPGPYIKIGNQEFNLIRK